MTATMAELLDDLESELMDLESNEMAYMPMQPQPMLRHTFSGRSSFSGANEAQRGASLPEAPADARLAGRMSSLSVHSDTKSSAYSVPSTTPYQYQQQYQQTAPNTRNVVQQQQARGQPQSTNTSPAAAAVASAPPPPRTSSSSSLSLSSLSASSAAVSSSLASIASSLGLRASESPDANQDEPWMRKKAAFSAIARLRHQQITDRVGMRVTSSTVRQPLWDPHVDAMMQMAAKLDAVIEASLQELQARPEVVALWTQVLAELPTEESDYMAKAADEKFEEQMKYCTSRRDEREIHKCIDHHLQAILVSSVPTRNGYSMGKAMNHSLGQLLRDFRGVFLACYETFVAQYEVHQVAHVLPLVSADVLQFSSILVQLLVFKYAFLAKWKEYVRRCVIAVLFELLQPTLHGLYVGAFQTEDAVMCDITGLKRANPPAEFRIAPVFRLDGSWRPRGQPQVELPPGSNETPEASRQQSARQYSAVIYKMNNLASIRSPWVKIETLASICRDIDATIKQFYAQRKLQQPVAEQPSLEEINVYAHPMWTTFVSGNEMTTDVLLCYCAVVIIVAMRTTCARS